MLPGAEAGEEPLSRAGLPPPRLPPDVMAAHNEPGEKGGRRDAPPCLPRVLQGRGTLQGRKRGAFGAGPPSHPCLMGMAHLTGTSPQRAAGTLPRLQEHLRAWMEHIPAWGFRENLRDAGRKQGIVIGRGTGERGERLHLRCAPLGVLLSQDASSQCHSGRGVPCPLVKGCRRDPNASHGLCEASLLSFRIPQPALMNSNPSLAFLLLAEDLGSQRLQELLLCRATSAASPAWLSSRGRLPQISAFCYF